MSAFENIYRGRKVLVTGYTGFKGSWLSLWLKETLGAEVAGIALPPVATPNHWDLLGLEIDEHRLDVCDGPALRRIIGAIAPEIVFHLAAQPLVRVSYRDPVGTWSVNVGGTVNLLEACRCCDSVRAIVVVTSDKCYLNREQAAGYRESDQLGGHDPYSASKAAAELVAASYRRSFFSAGMAPLLATARAGNVIGGGDWSPDRLIPDLARALAADLQLVIRSPKAVRPWQHVLESLQGYLMLGQRLFAGDRTFADAWNFGPPPESTCQVEELLFKLKLFWPELKWSCDRSVQPHEAQLLSLDSSKANAALGWKPVWGLDRSLAMTAQWYRRFAEERMVSSREQLREYIAGGRAQSAG